MGVLVGSRYRIEARLGAGGMGVVFRAQDERLGRAVALKVVSKKGGSSAVRRLLREARAVASLEHRGIAVLFDALDEPHLGVVLVMELVRGRSLRDVAAAGCEPAEAARIVLDVAESLGAAHRAGLVHRDVKPDNVMVREDGRTALLDFGIAKAMSERHDSSGQLPDVVTGDTTEGLVVGTPAYLAPEQALASAEITGAADQFALGVVAYELLTGQSPWKSATSGATLIAQIVGAEPAKPSALRPGLRPQVDEVIARAMSKKPTERFESVEAFGRALVAAVRGADPARVSIPEAPAGELPFARTERFAPEATTARRMARGGRRWALVGGGVALSLLAAVVVVREARKGPKPSPIVVVASAPAPAAARVTYADIPMSPTKSPEAAKAFREAMLDLRDNDDAAAGNALDDAIRLDPDFESARLQRAIRARLYEGQVAAGRDDYLHAARGRAALPERDAALLDALEPTFNVAPADLEATERKLTTLVSPSSDAQLWNLLGRVRRRLERLEPAAEAYARESAIDPQSAIALDLRAVVLESLGDLAGARASYEKCFRTQPRAAGCRASLVALLDEVGDCEAYVQRAREYAAFAPSDPDALLGKVFADGSANVPRIVLEDMTRSIKGGQAFNMRAWIHELHGELGAAADQLALVEAAGVADRDTFTAAYARAARVIEWGEAGRASEAVRLASEYDARLASMPPLEHADEDVFDLLSVLARAKKISAESLRSRRAAWLAKWLRPDASPLVRFYFWASAHARGVADVEEATEAVAALPSFVDALPTPRVRWAWSQKEAIARTFVLAGRPEARAFLQAAMSDCTPNFYGTRAHYWSGRAYEASGDTAAACADYARVLARWGDAKPRSVTADASRERMRALRCGAL